MPLPGCENPGRPCPAMPNLICDISITYAVTRKDVSQKIKPRRTNT